MSGYSLHNSQRASYTFPGKLPVLRLSTAKRCLSPGAVALPLNFQQSLMYECGDVWVQRDAAPPSPLKALLSIPIGFWESGPLFWVVHRGERMGREAFSQSLERGCLLVYVSNVREGVAARCQLWVLQHALLSLISILKIYLNVSSGFPQRSSLQGGKGVTVQYLEADLWSEIQYFLATCCPIPHASSGKSRVPQQIIVTCVVAMPSIFHCGKYPTTITWTFFKDYRSLKSIIS